MLSILEYANESENNIFKINIAKFFEELKESIEMDDKDRHMGKKDFYAKTKESAVFILGRISESKNDGYFNVELDEEDYTYLKNVVDEIQAIDNDLLDKGVSEGNHQIFVAHQKCLRTYLNDYEIENNIVKDADQKSR